MSDERIRILEMFKEGKLSAEETLELLKAYWKYRIRSTTRALPEFTQRQLVGQTLHQLNIHIALT